MVTNTKLLPDISKQNYLKLGFFICCLVALLFGVFRPDPPPSFFPYSDKVMHFAVFCFFTVVSRITFAALTGHLFWIVLIAASLLLELLQPMVQPIRQFSYLDLTANLTGVAIACVLWGLWLRRRESPATVAMGG